MSRSAMILAALLLSMVIWVVSQLLFSELFSAEAYRGQKPGRKLF